MANKHYIDLVVVPLQEQVQQDEKTFGDVFRGLGHGARNVHQAEHDGLGAGVGLLDQQVVLEVKGVEEGHAVNTCAKFLDFGLQGFDIAEIIGFFAF